MMEFPHMTVLNLYGMICSKECGSASAAIMYWLVLKFGGRADVPTTCAGHPAHGAAYCINPAL